MIRVFLYDPEISQSSQGGTELIASWQQSRHSIAWVDIENEDKAAEEKLLMEFGVHELAIQDALRPRHPPKIERFDNFLFILLRGLDADSNGMEFDAIQLAMFVGDRLLISRHREKSLSANWLFDHLQQDASMMKDGAGPLAIRLANRLARRYVEILLELEPRLDEIEEEMFQRPDDELLSELTRYKSRLRKVTRIASYHERIATQLRNMDDSLLGKSLKHEIMDLYEQIERGRSLASLYYQIANDLTDGYLGMSSHRLNRVMQILTIITVIFVPLTFLAGIYGMNFERMPELKTRNGYFVVVGIMLLIAITQIIYFRRKRWL